MPYSPQIDENHVHSYVRSHFTDDKKKMIWKCDHPKCHHTLVVPSRDRSMIIGRASLCPECQETEIVLTSKDVQRKRPICETCRNPARKEIVEKSKGIIEELFRAVKE